MRIIRMFNQQRHKPIDYVLEQLWRKVSSGVWFKVRSEMFTANSLLIMTETVRLQVLDEY